MVIPVLISPKPSNRGYRMLVEVKFPNSQAGCTLAHAISWWHPTTNDRIFLLLYAILNEFKCYWQLPVTSICGEVYSFIKPFGTSTTKKVIQGASNSGKHFQSEMEEALELHKYDEIILWLDDILSHANGPTEILQILAKLFQGWRVNGAKLSARKWCLFQTSIKWCGRNISSGGIAYHPDYIQGIMNMPKPEIVADFQHFLCALR